MSESLTFIQSLVESERRRCWLLYKALECAPLDKAIDLARAADEFIVGAHCESREIASRLEPEIVSPPQVSESQAQSFADGVSSSNGAAPSNSAAGPTQTAAPKVAAEVRQQLIDRIASGGKNADLAAEFGLAPKQVQGIRIGCAREIARKAHDKERPAAPAQSRTLPAIADDVIRYLRQEHDVVVPQGNNEFLVNARFRMSLAELINRANRMRVRQGKLEFELGSGALSTIPSTHTTGGMAGATSPNRSSTAMG
jgi:hypothetical protein